MKETRQLRGLEALGTVRLYKYPGLAHGEIPDMNEKRVKNMLFDDNLLDKVTERAKASELATSYIIPTWVPSIIAKPILRYIIISIFWVYLQNSMRSKKIMNKKASSRNG